MAVMTEISSPSSLRLWGIIVLVSTSNATQRRSSPPDVGTGLFAAGSGTGGGGEHGHAATGSLTATLYVIESPGRHEPCDRTPVAAQANRETPTSMDSSNESDRV
eukprot:2975566-Prymnesium_polylepis.1